MIEEEIELSESGYPIHRHDERKAPFEPAYTSSADVVLLEKHIEQHIGKVDTVWHELVSDLIHLDVHHIKPTAKRNMHTLVTTGMSDIPMNAPPQAEALKYAELLVTLPPTWPASEDDFFKTDENFWVVELLKWLARFPHVYETWLWGSHTVPNGNPAEPYPTTSFNGVIITAPATVPLDFLTLECDPDKTVHFFSVIPLYQEEMDLKLKKGMETLLDLFDKNGINEIIDVNRKNVGLGQKKGWWPF